MFQRSSLSALAIVAVGGALIAGCSNSTSATSAPAATSSAAAAASTTAAAASTASSAAAGAVSAADCKILAPISADAISTLTPLQSESTSQAEAGMKSYIAKLTADEAQLTSPAGKAALGSFITALGKTLTEPQSQAISGLTTAIGNLGSACS
jgi:NitT/TauT family transport system substrate-binding protein